MIQHIVRFGGNPARVIVAACAGVGAVVAKAGLVTTIATAAISAAPAVAVVGGVAAAGWAIKRLSSRD